MKKLLFLFLYLPIISMAQQDAASRGIHFIDGLSWQQVKQKAKQENKYIFLDCYTTWCGPCKMMDASVYPNDSVGNYFNQHFISVKVQMDKTKKDNEQIKSWYDDASAIGKEYHVEGYPTFVFLSPAGEIVNKDLGLKGVNDFISIAQTATAPGYTYNDPYKNYDTLAAAYRQGKRDYESYPLMITMASKSNDTAFANKLVKELSDYAMTLTPEERYTKDRIQMWAGFSWSSKTRVFQFFYKDAKLIDKVMTQKNYARDFVDRTIMTEIVTPFLVEQATGSKIGMTGGYLTDVSGKHLLKTDSSEADWEKLDKMIRRNYTADYAKRNLLSAKIEWYLRHRNYTLYAKYYLIKLDKYPLDINEKMTAGKINSFGWTVFLNITDKDLIRGAIKWMEKAIIYKNSEIYYTNIDTYANLLYKVGKIQEAIRWEEKTIEQAPNDKSCQYALEQMKKGEPTYVKEGAIWTKN